MGLVIRETVGVFIVNPTDRLYKKAHKANAVKKFLSSIKQTYTIKHITVPNIYEIKVNDIAPLERSFNVVIIPSNTFHFGLVVHSGHIAIIVSLDAGNWRYSHGIYIQSLTLVRKFLGGMPVDIKPGSLYHRMKPEGKAIIVASMVDIKDTKYFAKIYNKLLSIRLDRRIKDGIIRVLTLKKNKYKLYSKKESV